MHCEQTWSTKINVGISVTEDIPQMFKYLDVALVNSLHDYCWFTS